MSRVLKFIENGEFYFAYLKNEKNINIFGFSLDFLQGLCYSFDKDKSAIQNGAIFF